MSTPRMRIRRADQRGATLLEVLVTMVVLALGLLGFAALQTVSMKSNRTALHHSYATTYAYDILDCMRANRVAADAGNYDIPMSDAAASSPTTIADRDIAAWLNSLAGNLPNGDGEIERSGGVVTVTVQWGEDPSDLTSFSTDSSL